MTAAKAEKTGRLTPSGTLEDQMPHPNLALDHISTLTLVAELESRGVRCFPGEKVKIIGAAQALDLWSTGLMRRPGPEAAKHLAGVKDYVKGSLRHQFGEMAQEQLVYTEKLFSEKGGEVLRITAQAYVIPYPVSSHA
jgi:hypothetical protein